MMVQRGLVLVCIAVLGDWASAFCPSVHVARRGGCVGRLPAAVNYNGMDSSSSSRSGRSSSRRGVARSDGSSESSSGIEQQQQQEGETDREGDLLPSFVPDSTRKFLAGMMVGLMLMGGGGLFGPPASYAGSVEESKETLVCLLKSCKVELAKCVLSPVCLSNLVCLNNCASSPNETECQIKCGDTFESPTIGEFNTCAVSQKKCVPQKKDDGSYPVPAAEALVSKFDVKTFDGRWYITAGLNPLFDCFDCQAHFFASPEPGKVFAKINWRVNEPDGEFFQRNVVQKFVQTKENPAILLNHDNDYLHYQDDWYILDSEPNDFVLIYYRGQNDAWVGYGGATLYTREAELPQRLVPRLEKAMAKANVGWQWKDFTPTDNSCKPQDASSSVLRAQYANKLLMTEGDVLAKELTSVRGVGLSEIEQTGKGAARALEQLEKLSLEYEQTLEKELEKDVQKLEKEVVKDVVGIEKEVVKDVVGLEKEVVKDVVGLEKEVVKDVKSVFGQKKK